jgi:cell division protein FtsW (lipid II flippase)
MSLSSLRFEPAHKPVSLDYMLLLTLVIIASIGLFVLYSASGESSEAMTRQGLRLGIGLAAFVVIAQIPPRYLRVFTPWIFIGVLGLLPTKGIPLPFVSNGGSSMLVNLFAMGILLNITQHASAVSPDGRIRSRAHTSADPLGVAG